MEARKLSEETKRKVLKCAINIINMNGGNAGDRVCQEWSGADFSNPKNIFTEKELDDLSFNYELDNSNLRDYDKEHNFMHDEVVASFAIAQALKTEFLKEQ